MGREKYTVIFKNGIRKTIRAWNANEAEILAQAEMIKEGKSHNIESTILSKNHIKRNNQIYYVHRI